jgi:hypothetical protein
VLASDPSAMQNMELDFVLSPACLLGLCTGSAASNPCSSLSCQCDCHTRPSDGLAEPADQFPRQRQRSG